MIIKKTYTLKVSRTFDVRADLSAEQVKEMSDHIHNALSSSDSALFEVKVVDIDEQIMPERPDEVGIDSPYPACPRCGCDACEDALNQPNIVDEILEDFEVPIDYGPHWAFHDAQDFKNMIIEAEHEGFDGWSDDQRKTIEAFLKDIALALHNA